MRGEASLVVEVVSVAHQPVGWAVVGTAQARQEGRTVVLLRQWAWARLLGAEEDMAVEEGMVVVREVDMEARQLQREY